MIKQISSNELDKLVPFFDQYMAHYGKPDSVRYRQFLHDRLEGEEGIIFVAYDSAGEAIGFALNYFSFSTLALGKIVILNDLYVVPDARGQGIGESLVRRVFELAKENAAVRVDLGTPKDNLVAQKLYERLGFVRETEFFSYRYAV